MSRKLTFGQAIIGCGVQNGGYRMTFQNQKGRSELKSLIAPTHSVLASNNPRQHAEPSRQLIDVAYDKSYAGGSVGVQHDDNHRK